MVLKFFWILNLDEQIPGEQALPGCRRDYPDGYAILRVGAGIAVLNIEFPTLHVRLEPMEEGIEMGDIERPIYFSPPYLGFTGRLANDKPVVR